MARSLDPGEPESVDTIAAFATAVGGPIVVIRVSGPQALAIVSRVWQGHAPLAQGPHHRLRLGSVRRDSGVLDHQVMAVYMPGPHSYTGEDVVELQGHGGALGARLILLELLRQGCRHAAPGEFTQRAFLNGRIDLTQAEAVADLIAAHSESALHLANRQLDGALGRRVTALDGVLTGVLAEVESRLDFPEDDLDWLPPAELSARLAAVQSELADLLASRHEGEILREGVRLVIAGPPNVGKSSLLNAILGRDRAIVTEIPGTTRDTLEELAHIRGIPIRLTDTAGLRESVDLIERKGIERSRQSLRTAHVILWVFDASLPYREQAWETTAVTGTVILVGNKRDRLSAPPELSPGAPRVVLTCALTGAGLDELFDAVEDSVWGGPRQTESELAVSARHAALLEAALPQVADATARCCEQRWELAAVALRSALADLGRIQGRTVDPDVLGAIFSRFCIGK
jgi:tRNA modification GTPase